MSNAPCCAWCGLGIFYPFEPHVKPFPRDSDKARAETIYHPLCYLRAKEQHGSRTAAGELDGMPGPDDINDHGEGFPTSEYYK